MSEREMLAEHGTELVKLKPSSVVQAAQADMRRRERNAVEAQTDTPSYEQFAFHRDHVRKAVDPQDLLIRALMEPGRGLASAKYNTRLIYGDAGVLLAAIHSIRERAIE